MVPLIVVCFSGALLVCFSWVLLKLLKVLVEYKRWRHAVLQLPTRDTHWLWGNLIEYGGPDERGLKYHRDNVAQFPRVFAFWVGQFMVKVSLWHPETLKLILKSSEPKARRLFRMLKPWIGDGLLISEGNKWARNRRLLTPAFHFEVLKPYVDIKNRAVDILTEKIADYAKKDESFDICPLAILTTLDVMLQCTLSYKTDCQLIGSGHPYVAAIDRLSELTMDRFVNPLLHSDFVYSLTKGAREYTRHCDYVHMVSTDIINERRRILDKERAEGKRNKRYIDFLDTLLTARDDEGIGLSQAEIRDEVDTFLFEGHDTTASALYWTLFSIAEHPQHQFRIQEELDEILKDRSSDDILWEDLHKLNYLSMCMKEGLRLHSPVGFSMRELTQPLEVEGVALPPGTTVEINIYGVHHNPQVWDEPMEYRPERFSIENNDQRDAFAFIPFSAGSRNCIGQTFAKHELKIILAKILYRFHLELDADHKVEKKIGLVMRTQNGILLKAKPRKPFH